MKEGKKYSLQIIEDNLIILKYYNGTISDLDMEKAIKSEMLELSKGKAYHTIVMLNDITGSMTEEAKNFSANDKDWAKYRLSEAVCTNSFVFSLGIGAYLKIYKPIVNTKVFSKYEDALAWTNKIKSEIENK